MNYYVSKTELNLVDGKLIGTETILTRPDKEAVITEGKRRYSRIGINNLHVVEYDKKRYSKLLREQNKRRKENPLTVSDIAKMTEQAKELDSEDSNV